jgi:hypothetical protein
MRKRGRKGEKTSINTSAPPLLLPPLSLVNSATHKKKKNAPALRTPSSATRAASRARDASAQASVSVGEGERENGVSFSCSSVNACAAEVRAKVGVR